MRSYRGDLVAVTAILMGTLGSAMLYRSLTGARVVTRTMVVDRYGSGLGRPDEAVMPPNPGLTVLRFRVANPAGQVFLVGPDGDQLVTAGTELALGNGRFLGGFRTHDGLRPIHLEVEVIQGGGVTSSGTVTSIRPRIAVSGRNITIFGL